MVLALAGVVADFILLASDPEGVLERVMSLAIVQPRACPDERMMERWNLLRRSIWSAHQYTPSDDIE